MRLPTYQDLSKEQDAVNNLPLTGRWLVTGPPGTGKTVMALYRSKMVSDAGSKPLLLMYGKLLSAYTKQAVHTLGIKGFVHAFHQWWWHFCRRVWRRSAPQIEKYHYDWDEIANWQIKHPAPRKEIPSLLVDEGQDLPPMFFNFARLLAKELTVFADENQRISEHNSTLEEIRRAIKPDGEHRLTRNYRNTRQIAEVAAHFFADVETGLPELPDRSGPPPVLRAFEKRGQSVQQVANYATTNRHQQIGVMVPTQKLVKSYVNGLATRGIEAGSYIAGGDVEAVHFAGPGITVVTWASAKGLEFDCVFVPELQANWLPIDSPILRMQLYVLCSRARERLFLSWTGAGEPEILALMPFEKLRMAA